MDYEHDTTLSNMYLGNEIRFDGLGRLVKSIAAKFERRSTACNPLTAKA